jgi:hypothetical protein
MLPVLAQRCKLVAAHCRSGAPPSSGPLANPASTGGSIASAKGQVMCNILCNIRRNPEGACRAGRGHRRPTSSASSLRRGGISGILVEQCLLSPHARVRATTLEVAHLSVTTRFLSCSARGQIHRLASESRSLVCRSMPMVSLSGRSRSAAQRWASARLGSDRVRGWRRRAPRLWDQADGRGGAVRIAARRNPPSSRPHRPLPRNQSAAMSWNAGTGASRCVGSRAPSHGRRQPRRT